MSLDVETSARLALTARSRRIVERLKPYPSLAALDAAASGAALRAETDALLGEVRRHVASNSGIPARSGETARRVHVVHWNIEHGNRYDAIVRALSMRPELVAPDVVSLNEVDLGMARSGNRDVAFEIADALGLHAVWAPMFLELTVGRHDDPRFAGTAENREAFFGLAALSRHPLGAVRTVTLPSFEEFGFRGQRMYGRHVAIVVEVLHPVRPFLLVTTHLNVHGSPPDRRRQIEAVLRALDGEPRPIVLAGDFNTFTFHRGNFAASLAGLGVLAGSLPGLLRHRLTHPDHPVRAPRESLFAALRDAGFRWDEYNDFAPTLRLRFERIKETEVLPAAIRPHALRALRALSGRSLLRLDWIAARGFGRGRGVTIPSLDHGPEEASDHLPLAAWIDFAEET